MKDLKAQHEAFSSPRSETQPGLTIFLYIPFTRQLKTKGQGIQIDAICIMSHLYLIRGNPYKTCTHIWGWYMLLLFHKGTLEDNTIMLVAPSLSLCSLHLWEKLSGHLKSTPLLKQKAAKTFLLPKNTNVCLSLPSQITQEILFRYGGHSTFLQQQLVPAFYSFSFDEDPVRSKPVSSWINVWIKAGSLHSASHRCE